MTIVIWIDANVDNQINTLYVKEFQSMGFSEIKLLKEIEEAIIYLKQIEFEDTKIIISGRLYAEFVDKFILNIKEMLVAPKIIVFTSSKESFVKYNPEYYNNKFYSFGGIAIDFQKLKYFLKNDNKADANIKYDNISHYPNTIGSTISEFETKIFNDSGQIQLTFEYIDCLEKLMLPLFFKVLIDNASNDNMEFYTNFLHKTYSRNIDVKKLLGPIDSIPKVPMDILVKYYVRLYILPSNFHSEINKDLGLNKKEKYLSYIKTLYEGVNLKALPLASKSLLYRGSLISKEEINNIKSYLDNKKKDLPGSIVFSKSFFLFQKKKK